MTRLDVIPPDQRAVVSLVLEQGRSYEELAALLRIDAESVRDRAQAALEALGPHEGVQPPPDRRGEIADFLLSQQRASQRAATRAYLERSAAARAWARVVAGELRPVAGDALPDIPEERRALDESRPAAGDRDPRGEHAPRSSRLGGAVLLGGIGILVAVVLVLILGGGGTSNHSNPTTSSTSTGPAPTTTSAAPQVLAQVNLAPPSRGSKAIGVANVLAQGQQRALAIQAQGLAPSSTRSFYAVWLYNSASDAQRLGFAPPVASDGHLQAVSALNPQAGRFHELIITTETQRQPTRPGRLVLAGRFSLPAG